MKKAQKKPVQRVETRQEAHNKRMQEISDMEGKLEKAGGSTIYTSG